MYDRRQFICIISAIAGGAILFPENLFSQKLKNNMNYFSPDYFGDNFNWGVAASAFQTEGSTNIDGRSASIWDIFTTKKGKIKNNENANLATEFYNRYSEDLSLLRSMNFDSFRFSLSWSRILPGGTGQINQKGIDFYNKVIDLCLKMNITPWVTLYHWDLPQVLEDKGGWTNRNIVGWFEEYSRKAASCFGDRVKNWIILNEPLAFTSFGYLNGTHAPGKKGIHNFLPAVHHAALCQSTGVTTIRNNCKNAMIGSTFSCSVVEPVNNSPRNSEAAERVNAVLNRLFIEPALGKGYPTDSMPFFRHLEKYYKPGDENLLKADLDFFGLQYYFRVVVKAGIVPPLYSREIKAADRNVPLNTMNLEVYPQGITKMLETYASYPGIKKIIVTESGVCFNDVPTGNNEVLDIQRKQYHQTVLQHILESKNKGIPVDGYFVWSLTDNFEWNKGYTPRFGLVYIDYATQKRYIKESGKWFRDFLGQN